jgi:hypothetical protein
MTSVRLRAEWRHVAQIALLVAVIANHSNLTAPDFSQQCPPGPLPRLDLVLDPRFAGAERVESPATQLKAGS